jgi:hypothetical protein
MNSATVYVVIKMNGKKKNPSILRQKKKSGHLTEFKCENKEAFSIDQVLVTSAKAKYNY